MALLTDDNRAKAIARAGFRRPGAFRLWSDLLWRLRPRHIFDIGANHGEMSLPLLLREEQRLHLFEPNPQLFELLRRSVRSHIQAGQISVSPIALSDHAGESKMYVDRKWSGTSSLDYPPVDAPFKGAGEQLFDEVTIVTGTLDEYFAGACSSEAAGPELIAIKIDVEGHETRVFEGAAAVLARPVIMLTEFSTANLRASGASPAGYLTMLRELGRVFRVRADRSLTEITRRDPRIGHADLVVTNDPAALRLIV